MQHLSVGVARETITPPVGTILYGYAPGRPAEAVGDDLTVTALCFKSPRVAAMIVNATICAINSGLCDRIRSLAQEATGIPARHVIVSATHTHSGPNISVKSAWGNVNEEYIEQIFVPRTLKAMRKAFDGLRPARMGVAVTPSDVGINRRELTPEGSIRLGQNPWGARDPEMTVVSFKGPDGHIIANLVHYCAHCTASGCNPEITRDWAGPMIDRLEEQSGGLTAFIAGAEGDQGPNLPNGRTTGNYKMALELGGKAAVDAVRAWRTIRDWRDAEAGVVTGDVRIPYLPLPSRETALAELERLGPPDALTEQKKYTLVNEYVHWKGVLEERDSGAPVKTEWVFPQTIISVGPVAFVPFPCEIFVEPTLRIRRASPFGHTLCLCNTNGCLAYFPSQDQICRGGYEVWHFRTRNVYGMVDDADNYAVAGNLNLLGQLFDSINK